MTAHYNQFRENDNELDLVDLWLVFLRHWKLLAAFLVVGAVLGLAYAMWRSPVYNYSTLIEIGTQLVNGQPQLIEAPKSVKAKIEKGYLTAALRDYYTAHPEDIQTFAVDVAVPDGADVVVLSSESSQANAAALREIHDGMVNRVLTGHERILEVIRQNLKTEMVSAQTGYEALTAKADILEAELQRLDEKHANRLASLAQQIELLQTELARLEQAAALVTRQIAELEGLLAEMQGNQSDAVDGVTDEAHAMTMLLINDQVQAAHQRLAALKERRDVAIPNEHDRLAAEIQDVQRERENLQNQLQTERERFVESIAANVREQRKAEASINELSLRIENLQATNVAAVAAKSVRPVGPGGSVFMTLSVLLAGFLWLAVVALLEITRVARQRLAAGMKVPDSEPARIGNDWPVPRELRKTAV